MDIEIGSFDADRKVVPVTFSLGEIVHKRDVNACLDEHGGYDADATKARVDAVAQGVIRKMQVGAISNPPPVEPEPAAEETPEAMSAPEAGAVPEVAAK